MPREQGKTFKIFGDKYNTDDGTCVRDYVHVMDLADAHIKALNYASHNPVAEVFNLGSGAPASNKQLLETVQKHTGKMNIEMHDNRPGDPAYLVADTSKVKEILDGNQHRVQLTTWWQLLYNGITRHTRRKYNNGRYFKRQLGTKRTN